MKEYTTTPQSVSFSDIISNNFSLSSSQYEKVVSPNSNLKKLREFLYEPLNRDIHQGTDIGSINYIDESSHYFLRTKALQKYNYLPELTKESFVPIKPNSFKNISLNKGDLIISKDSNIGEAVLLDKDYPNVMLSGAMYKLPISETYKKYIFAVIKHNYFREQLDLMVPRGATLRHAKTLFLDCYIPLPNKDSEDIINYISVLVDSVSKKERIIKERHGDILELIEEELENHKKDRNIFNFSYPTYSEIKASTRLDTNLYRKEYKKIKYNIQNYKFGFSSIKELGYSLARGQNLQVSNIGKSIYSKKKQDNFYELMLPKFLSKYGTVNKVEYLGNPNKLKTLNKGDLIFGAEGFEKGRSIVITDERKNVITNIHGITITSRESQLSSSIFIKCFLDYLRTNGIIDLFAVGGNGGSLAQKYWDEIMFPCFPENVKNNIVKLYYTPNLSTVYNKVDDISDFQLSDKSFNNNAGILELDKVMKSIKNRIDKVITAIVKNETVDVSFDFLKHL
ncbi:restriction endonuclease subunit S [Lactococcus lactis]|uniref:hypothetical protein n=1 Tax=Lactococcus lactis TaxID=1358 RepID=UPI00165215CF|nr:hypothetical protein [Lactococcus lactis]QNL92867.1 hypothetical protein HUG14_05300 [Lactococcus lactis]